MSAATSVAVGGAHTCAVLSDGTVQCWGYNGFGQLGHPTPDVYSTTPVTVTGVANATGVTAGYGHSCARLESGVVKCWGVNYHGQLGNGTTDNSPVPVRAAGISTARSVDAGQDHTCAVLVSGGVDCWGFNGSGQLGDRDVEGGASLVPSPVKDIWTATSVTAGIAHTCARLSTGSLRCWGSDSSGQIGNYDQPNPPFPGPGPGSDFATPQDVFGIGTATWVSAGYQHTCARLANASIWCWGQDTSGQLGDGGTTSSWTAARVVGIP
jgi:alpha-tubulin suppressor-like RCC1 family protein